MGRERKVLIAFCVIVFIAFFLRFYALDFKPLHHDEGTHWFSFIKKIYSGEPLIYYPTFHGFTSYYLSAVPFFFVGVSVFALRFMVALFGALTVALLFPLRKHLGDFGLLFSALFLAVSPTMVYYSRHVSQYGFFVFFLLLSFACLALFFESFKKRYLFLSAISLALLYTTHDLALVFFAICASFVFLLHFFDFSGRVFKRTVQRVASRVDIVLALEIGFLLFFFVIVLVMSSFFTNFSALSDFLSGTGFQFEKSFETGHNKQFFYYLFTFFPVELPVFLGSILSVFFLKRNHFFVFVSYWVLASFFIFSMIPYKIPWMFPIVLLPMFILTGLMIDSVFSSLKKTVWQRNLAILVLLAFLAFSLFVSIDLNYVRPTSKENPLNYVGPTDDAFALLRDLNAYLEDKNASILITAKSYWPLPFYLRGQTVSYVSTRVADSNKTSYAAYDMVITDELRINNGDANQFSERKEYELRKNYFIIVLYGK